MCSSAKLRHGAASIAFLAAAGLLSACASSPLVEGSALSSYDAMTPSNGLITKSRINVHKEEVLAAETVTILPTAFLPTAGEKLSDAQRALVANAIDRALCISLSDRFRLVAPHEPADVIVVATVTHTKQTNRLAAGASAAAMIGMNFVDLGLPVPVPTPRLPVGLGNMSVEAEAIDPSGMQVASMVWGKGATMLTSPKISRAGDSYVLAKAFGDDFGHLLVEGESPRDNKGIDLPSRQRVNSAMGGAPKYAACESYGRSPGIKGLVGGQLGLPPEWTDKGAAKTAPEG